jgi:hypothetical protein
MIFPPSILWISIKEANGKGFRLWLPLFLVWWLIIPVLLIVPWISALSRYHPTRFRSPFRAAVWLVVAFCSIRGLTVSVKGDDSVYVAFR